MADEIDQLIAESSAESRPGEQWSMLVHDLRNPLATIKGYAELPRRRAARGQVQPGDMLQSLRHIQDALGTIEGLLDRFRGGAEARSPARMVCTWGSSTPILRCSRLRSKRTIPELCPCTVRDD
jgi:signal transduction histidine kinase